MKFADPKTDIAFKKIFGSEKHKIVLIEFLNTVLELEHLIEDVEILNPYQAPKLEGLKETTLDVRARDQKKNEFIVEMQVEKESGFHKRVTYYSSKAYVAQIPEGGKYHELKPVIFLGVLNFKIFQTEDYISRHLVLDKKTLEHTLTDFDFNFIELPKFRKTESELENLADKWVYFLKEALHLKMIPESADTKALKQAYEIANQYGWSKRELEIYEYQEIQATKFENIIDFNRREAREQGVEEGIEKGIEKGSRNKQIEIAKNLLLATMETDFIVQVTGLSAEEIENLKNGEA